MRIEDAEIILDNGSFASIRAPAFRDFIAAGAYSGADFGEVLLVLCARCVRIDGELLSEGEWEILPVSQINQVLQSMIQLNGPAMGAT